MEAPPRDLLPVRRSPLARELPRSASPQDGQLAGMIWYLPYAPDDWFRAWVSPAGLDLADRVLEMLAPWGGPLASTVPPEQGEDHRHRHPVDDDDPRPARTGSGPGQGPARAPAFQGRDRQGRVRRELTHARNQSSGAYGKYQIMPANWPSWGEALSRRLARQADSGEPGEGRERQVHHPPSQAGSVADALPGAGLAFAPPVDAIAGTDAAPGDATLGGCTAVVGWTAPLELARVSVKTPATRTATRRRKTAVTTRRDGRWPEDTIAEAYTAPRACRPGRWGHGRRRSSCRPISPDAARTVAGPPFGPTARVTKQTVRGPSPGPKSHTSQSEGTRCRVDVTCGSACS